MSQQQAVNAQIMGQSYVLSAPNEEVEDLRLAISRVDASMCRIRDAGKIKALAITSKHASPKFPGVKSLHEQGFTNFEVEPWYGMIGSKGLPKELAERMNGYVQDILKQDSVKQKISDLGAEAYGMSTGEFAKLIDADIKKWGEAVKASGATAD